MSTKKTKSDHTYDVLIVGAGPAGSSAAKELVKNGYRVLVVERKRLPRYKICSGLIVERSLDLLEEYFGNPPEEVFSEPRFPKGARLCLAGDKFTDVPTEKSQGLCVWRSDFDHWLIQQSGADVMDEHQVVGVSQTDEKVRVGILKRDGETIEIEASYVIGADGGGSSVRRLVDPVIKKKIHWVTFVQRYCHGTIPLEPEYFYAFFDPSLIGFYNWLNFKDDYLVYGIGAPKGTSVTPYLENLTEYLKKTFGMQIDEVVRRTGCVATDMGLNDNFVLGLDRVLLAGEAAGFMNGLGEGISSALATGHIVAQAIHQAETASEEALPIYCELAKPEQELTTLSWEMVNALLGRGFLDQPVAVAQTFPTERSR